MISPVSRLRWWQRPSRAAVALLGVYVALSFAADPGGTLGTDTGAKVATMRAAADRGHSLGDVGYWAEADDRAGRFHPLYQTRRVGDRWVVVTTLPALLVGTPLYDIGGYRLALLVPMAGAALAAWAAAAFARRLGGASRAATRAFWAVGLLTPVTVYALDFWEHALGVAAVGWGGVLVLDAVRGRRPWLAPLAAGALFGLAGSMRTEAFVYGAIAFGAAAVAVLLGLRRVDVAVQPEPGRDPLTRRLRRVALIAAPAVLAGGAVVVAGLALETAVLGEPIRGGRIQGTAATAGGALALRAKEAGLTSIGFHSGFSAGSLVLGGAVVALVAIVVSSGRDPDRERVVKAAAAAVIAMFGAHAAAIGFVPGLLVASPLAAAGLAAALIATKAAATSAARAVVGAAVVALPVVWAFQYTGGAGPQWGGRYVLPSGWALAVVAILAFEDLRPVARTALVVVAAVATGLGVAWLAVRSHQIADAGAELADRQEDVLISRDPFLVREWGSRFGSERDRRWLTAPTATDVAGAARIAARAGARTIGLVEVRDRDGTRPATDPQLSGFTRRGSDSIRLFFDADVRVVTYERTAR